MLAKYYVRDAPIPSDQGLPTERFDWDDKGFYKTLQRRVFESLGPVQFCFLLCWVALHTCLCVLTYLLTACLLTSLRLHAAPRRP